MQFTGKNYWEQGASPRERALAMLAAAADQNGNPNPNPGNGMNVGTYVAPDPLAAAQVQALQPPPEDDTSRLVKEVVAANADNPGVYPWSRPFDPVQNFKDQSAYVPGTDQLKTDPAASGGAFDGLFGAVKNVASNINGADLSKLFTTGATVNQGAADAAGGIWGAISKAAQGIAGEANYAESPMGIYEKLRRETPGYSYNGPSAADMAKQQFSPLFQMLTEQAKQGESRYNTARDRAKQSYAGFINDLLASQKSDQAAYTQAGKDIGAAGDAAAKSVTGNVTDSSKALLAELAQLGVTEGSGGLIAKNEKNLTDTLGTLAANRQTAQNVNSGLKAAEYASDTGNINTSRQAGLNYQGDLYSGYLDQLNQNDQQRLQLQGQQGQAQNQYAMQIQDLLQKGATSRDEGINNIFKTMMDNQNRDQQFGLDQQRFGLDQDKFGLEVQKYDKSQTPDSNNAYRTLEAQANQAFGNPEEAAIAAQTLMGALRQAPQATDLGTLLAQIPEEELRKPHMADLAYAFFNSVLNNKGL
jgi:hypothetical protein